MDAKLAEPSTPAEERTSTRVLVALNKLRLWPWIAFVLVTLFFNVAIYGIFGALLSSDAIPSSIAVLLVPAVLYGEFCIALVVCGLCGQTWLEGYAAACLLGIIGWSFVSIGEFADRWLFRSNFNISIRFSDICDIPRTILFSSVGLLLFRALGGWRLSRPGSPPSKALDINDLIIGTSLVALLVMLGRTVQVYNEQTTTEYWFRATMTALFFALTGLVAIVPTVWIVFRATRLRALKLVATGVSISILSGVVTASVGMLTGPSFDSIQDSVFAAAGTLIAFNYLVIGLTALRKTGLQLSTGKQTTPTDVPCKVNSLRRYGVPVVVFTCIIAIHLILNVAIAVRQS